MAETENANMSIWNQVEVTPPSATKTSNYQGRDMTSINAQYMVQRATEMWGPIGINWGYEIVEERVDETGPLIFNNEIVGTYQNHTLRLKLWYTVAEKRYTVEHFGHTPYVYRSRNGPMVDQDAPKKSLTDALKKCLSMLGFAADIFLGMYDDQDYVEGVKTMETIQKAEDRDAAIVEEITALKEIVTGAVADYKLVPSASALKLAHQSKAKALERKADALIASGNNVNKANYLKKLKEAHDVRLYELVPHKACGDCNEISIGKGGEPCEQCGSINTTPMQAKGN